IIPFSLLPARIVEVMGLDEQCEKAARAKISAELSQMVADGKLVVYDALTHKPFVVAKGGDAPRHAVLANEDFVSLLDSMGVSLHRLGETVQLSAQHSHISVDDAISLVVHAVDCSDDVVAGGFTSLEALVAYMEENI